MLSFYTQQKINFHDTRGPDLPVDTENRKTACLSCSTSELTFSMLSNRDGLRLEMFGDLFVLGVSKDLNDNDSRIKDVMREGNTVGLPDP